MVVSIRPLRPATPASHCTEPHLYFPKTFNKPPCCYLSCGRECSCAQPNQGLPHIPPFTLRGWRAAAAPPAITSLPLRPLACNMMSCARGPAGFLLRLVHQWLLLSPSARVHGHLPARAHRWSALTVISSWQTARYLEPRSACMCVLVTSHLIAPDGRCHPLQMAPTDCMPHVHDASAF
jgi:hypothetical protein